MKLTDENGKEYEFKGNRYAEPITMGWHGALFELPPKPKKIDMSVCIDSGIDCEFASDKQFIVKHRAACLGKITLGITTGKFVDSAGSTAYHCRPRMNHIHANPKGWDECPIPEGYKVRVWLLNNNSELIQREWNGGDFEYKWPSVVMFEILEIREGYTL